MTQSNRTTIAAAIIAMSASSSAFADSINPVVEAARSAQAVEINVPATSQSAQTITIGDYVKKQQVSSTSISAKVAEVSPTTQAVTIGDYVNENV